MTASLKVSQAQLAQALKVLGRRASERKGQVILLFNGQDLILRAGRIEATIPATGTWPGEARVAGNPFLTLWRAMPEADPLPVCVEKNRLQVASFSVSCTWREITDAFPATNPPVDATQNNEKNPEPDTKPVSDQSEPPKKPEDIIRNSGLDPDMMEDGIYLTGYHIERGARTFAAYVKAMIADMGDMVKPYLKSWYMALKYDVRAASFKDSMDAGSTVEAADIDAILQGDLPVETISDQQKTSDMGWLAGFEPEESDQADTEKRALDELFTLAQKYCTSKSYWELLQFIAQFRFYSPYNAMLVHIQMPGARFVASARRWQKEYHRNILPNAHPLVILRPGGPVMFVFDVNGTEATQHSTPLPSGVENPFMATGLIGRRLEMAIENARRDGIQVLWRKEGSQSAGSIRSAPKGAGSLQISRHHPKSGTVDNVDIPIRYTVLINEVLNRESRYTTLVHELAHLYCGHLGTPNEKWWPDRTKMPKQTREFEAESVAYLVCGRLGITSPSEEYLAGYVSENGEVPEISMDCVMKAAGLIEQMSKKWLGLRKDGAE